MEVVLSSWRVEQPTDGDWSKFVKHLGMSETEGSSEFEKICVLIKYHSTGESYEFRPHCCVYVIDVDSCLNTPRPQPLEPLIYWDILEVEGLAFATLGSKLFLFGGLEVFDGVLDWGFSMSYYDLETCLSSPITTPLRLRKDSFVQGPNMSGRKMNPCALVIGDSMICVFGEMLYTRGEPSSSVPNFELLCVTATSLEWKTLPEPLIYSELGLKDLSLFSKSVSVRNYCVHRSCLIVKLQCNGIYGINVDHPHPKWVTLDRGHNATFPFNGMFAMVHKMLCNGFNMVKWEDLFDPIPFEVSSNRGSHLVTSPKSAVCFDNRCNAFCLAQSAFLVRKFQGEGRLTSNRTAYLFLDIVKLDAEALRIFEPDEPDSPTINSNKSFTFQLPKNSLLERLEITACLPIKNASRNNKSVAEVDQGKRKNKKKKSVAEVDLGKRKKRKNQGNMKKKLKMTNMKLKMTNMKLKMTNMKKKLKRANTSQ